MSMPTDFPADTRRLISPSTLNLHPQAALVPEMPRDQYEPFAADVKQHGVQKPIELIPGTTCVIDGRSRLKAALDADLAAVPVVDADLDGDTPVMYMMRVALLRRHLKPGQAAALGVAIKKQLAAETKQKQREGAKKGGEQSGKTRRGEQPKVATTDTQPSADKTRAPGAREQAAALVGSSPVSISTAERIQEKSPAAFKKLQDGDITLAEAKREAKIAPKPQADTMEAGLKRALFRMQDAEKRWDALRKGGADDAKIKEQLGYEWGLGGASSGGAGCKWIAYKGGKQPAFFYNRSNYHGKPTLKGKALIDAVRRLLEIPPAPAKEPPAVAGGTALALIPKFPSDALVPLAANGIRTVEQLDAKVAELQKQGRHGVGRFTVLREVAGLDQPLVLKIGNVLDGHFAPPKPAPVKSREDICATLHELNPCPFCGAKGDYLAVLGKHSITCHNCGAMGPNQPSEGGARAAWNKRAKK